jgi:small-conductance mechanosensitive channel
MNTTEILIAQVNQTENQTSSAVESVETTGFLFTKLFSLLNVEFALINFLLVGAILLLGFLSRKLISKNFNSALRKAKIDVKGKRLSGHVLVKQIINFLTFILILVSFGINNDVSFSEFLKTPLIELDDKSIQPKVKHIFILAMLFFLSKIAINLVSVYLDKLAHRKKELDEGSKYIYLQLARYFIYVIAIFIFLKSLEVQLTALFTAAAGLFIAFAFGLQDLFKDLVSGFVLLFEGAIRVGDIIEIKEATGSEPLVAKVLRINLRTTKIETRDSNIYIIPNSRLTQEYVENWNFGSTLTRFRIPIRVAFGSDTELAKKLLIQAALSHPKVKKNKDIFVRLLNFGENGLEMDLVFYADQSWRIEIVKSEIRFEIDRLFREYGVIIPYPQRVLHQGDQKKKKDE